MTSKRRQPKILVFRKPVDQTRNLPQKIAVKPKAIDNKGLASLMPTEANWGRGAPAAAGLLGAALDGPWTNH